MSFFLGGTSLQRAVLGAALISILAACSSGGGSSTSNSTAALAPGGVPNVVPSPAATSSPDVVGSNATGFSGSIASICDQYAAPQSTTTEIAAIGNIASGTFAALPGGTAWVKVKHVVDTSTPVPETTPSPGAAMVTTVTYNLYSGVYVIPNDTTGCSRLKSVPMVRTPTLSEVHSGTPRLPG